MTFLDVARDLATLRKAHAAEFLMQRVMHSRTDGQAKAAADELYIYDLTMAEARYEIAKKFLEVNHADPRSHTDDEPTPTGTDDEGTGKDCAD